MKARESSVQSVERDGAEARVSGRIDFANAAEWLPRGSTLTAPSAQPVRVNLSGLRASDSAALAVLLAWSAAAQKAGTQLRFDQMPDDLRALAHLSEVESLLGIGDAS
ncbi:MAG: STAS domain-containing protein [Dokdonella sp.]